MPTALSDLQKKFWSTKDPGQEAFVFTIGMGQVIPAWCTTRPAPHRTPLVLAVAQRLRNGSATAG